MSNFDASAIRRKLVDRLVYLHGGITVYELAPSQPLHLPCLIVYPPDSIDYSRTSQRGLDVGVFTILLLVGPQDPRAQEVVEGVMSGTGDLSLITKLYEDRKLDGTVSNLRMLDVTSGVFSVSVGAEDNVLGAEFRVEVAA